MGYWVVIAAGLLASTLVGNDVTTDTGICNTTSPAYLFGACFGIGIVAVIGFASYLVGLGICVGSVFFLGTMAGLSRSQSPVVTSDL